MGFVTNNSADRLLAGGLLDFCSNQVATIIIYQGTIPADPDTWTQAGSSGNELARTSTGFTFQMSLDANSTQQPRVIFDDLPPSFNASATGTAAWYVMTAGGSPEEEYFMGECSTTGNGGTLILSSLSLVASNPVLITGFSVAMDGIG